MYSVRKKISSEKLRVEGNRKARDESESKRDQ